jgi:hypothetical protein
VRDTRHTKKRFKDMTEHTNNDVVEAASEAFTQLFDRLPSKAGGGLGKYEAMLDGETREILDEFVAWLEPRHTKNTANSYKSYVAKALAVPSETLSSDQKSGIRKFKEFLEDR